MTRLLLLSLLLLAACNRSGVADVTLDADAAQRNSTAAKTLTDLAAADAASRGPAPIIQDAPPPPREKAMDPAPVAVRAAPVAEAPDAPDVAAADDQADAVSNQ